MKSSGVWTGITSRHWPFSLVHGAVENMGSEDARPPLDRVTLCCSLTAYYLFFAGWLNPHTQVGRVEGGKGGQVRVGLEKKLMMESGL